MFRIEIRKLGNSCGLEFTDNLGESQSFRICNKVSVIANNNLSSNNRCYLVVIITSSVRVAAWFIVSGLATRRRPLQLASTTLLTASDPASASLASAIKAIYVLVAIILGSDVANCPIDYFMGNVRLKS